MPSEDFHVHGVHDHAIEHAAEHGRADTLPGRVAVLSAVLATLGALMTFAGGDTQTKANDEWSYYQAKGVKHNLAQFGANMSTRAERIEAYKSEAERYRKEQDQIKERADKLEEEVKTWEEKSDEQMHLHHRWAVGATAMQIAIALSAIVLLSRKTWLLYGVGLVALTGLAFGGMALAGI
jgi:hypothetical protein